MAVSDEPSFSNCIIHSKCIHRRFVRTEEDDGKGKAWEVDMAKEYYAKLFREYALIDLSKYKVRLSFSQRNVVCTFPLLQVSPA